MKASLINYRQSPRKVRLVVDLVRGKTVSEAISLLKFTEKRASEVISKLISSAFANAKNTGVNSDATVLFIKEISVDKGITLKRMMPRARGSSAPIRKRSSHVELVLGVKEVKEKVVKAKKTSSTKTKK